MRIAFANEPAVIEKWVLIVESILILISVVCNLITVNLLTLLINFTLNK